MSYSDTVSKLLASSGATEGCRLSVKSKGRAYTGTLMPHHAFSAEDAIVLKLSSGYNIGILMDKDSSIEVLEKPSSVRKETSVPEHKKGLKKLVFIGTGGTIASYVDYRTGGVRPALSAADLVNAVPEITEIANVGTRALFSVFSEDMTVEHWQTLAEAVAEELNGGADGVIIPHGTDTMGYTAAALSFMLSGVNKPVVLVGAQRSSDRPSSDSVGNILASARFCVDGNRAGVFVVMHDTTGDDSFAVHKGTRVRKMHTSRRDAFRSINAPPEAHIDINGKIAFNCEGRPVSGGKTVAKTDMEKNCVLLQFFPGMNPESFRDIIMKSKGVVIAGSGLGHVNENLIPLLGEACANGTVVVAASQCLGGTTNLNVYDTGRDMLSAGIVTVGDMLPETAYVKLMWALANTGSREEAIQCMKKPVAEESGDRREF